MFILKDATSMHVAADAVNQKTPLTAGEEPVSMEQDTRLLGSSIFRITAREWLGCLKCLLVEAHPTWASCVPLEARLDLGPWANCVDSWVPDIGDSRVPACLPARSRPGRTWDFASPPARGSPRTVA